MKHAGFTLVEILVAIFIFVLIAFGVTVFTFYYFQSYSFSFEEAQSIGQSQTAVTTMVREIREARISENGAWPLVETGDNQLVFYSDVTNDGLTDRVRYFLDGQSLKKGVIQPTEVPVSYPIENESIKILADNVSNGSRTLFTYYNGDWPKDLINNPLPNEERLLNSKYISIYLNLNITDNYGSQPFEMTTGVQIRSLKDNL